jgi:hypothetical protein
MYPLEEKEGEMNEEKARKILNDAIEENGDLGNGFQYVEWSVGDKDVILDGWFTADELEAIAWWMRNMGGKR